MKHLLIIPILFFLYLISCSNKSAPVSTNTNQGRIDLPLVGDSGYFTKLEGQKLLCNLGMLPQENTRGISIETTDTIGKYYRSTETGNYVCCILDVQDKFDFETHVLIELKPKTSGKFSVVAKQRYFHGNYACCWNTNYDGFNRYGNYFTLNTCGTGSGFCSTYVYYFKSVRPQDKCKAIPEGYYSMEETGMAQLSAAKTLRGDSLHCIYTLETAPWIGEDTLGPKEVESFSIDFLLKNGTFSCDEKLLERLLF